MPETATHPSSAPDPLQSAAGTLALLEAWVDGGWLRPLDRALAVFLHQHVPQAPPLLLLLAALTSHQVGRGHVCLELPALQADPDGTLSLPPEGGAEGAARPSRWLQGLDEAALAAALDCPELVQDGPGSSPLVRQEQRLYLRRYWDCEVRIGQALHRRMAAAADWQQGLDGEATRRWLERLFPAGGGAATDWQRLACALAAGRGFTVITGGPGTGKTTTVLRLLVLLQALQQAAADAPLRIRMAAPTGKAAARLNASVAGALARLPLDGVADAEALRAAIPTEVVTVHRLLGARPDSRHFRHRAGEPLPLDVLVVDEASMIDLELMASLLDALPPEARLILLGDKDQLASVEAGAVMGELCHRADGGHYTPATTAWLSEVSGESVPADYRDPAGRPLDQHIVMLRHSHRFGADSGIGALARAVNGGDAAAVEALWAAGASHPDIARLHLAGPEDPALEALAVAGGADHFAAGASGEGPRGYRYYLEAMHDGRPRDDAPRSAWDDWARSVLQAQGAFQLLGAVRRGPWGVEALNQRIAAALRDAGLVRATSAWYAGRPVIVTRNDYDLGLINGDMGVALAVPEGLAGGAPSDDAGRRDGARTVLRVAFLASDGSGRIRWVLPSRLEQVETAYALTVHKAQGSEFRHAALVLPDRVAPVLTRELLYTGITRASDWFSLLEPPGGVLVRAIRQRTLRSGGLRTRLV
ncbi:exodeoxyribonuclease V subunit alpha [Alkalilimnicola ehrlichii MLHE-1]|uniref:RecBCD enzyme subunit RecD n=1 Tax=Alkalilimnicola ehrlichii (strain ATCC BAA-1101 / DSM 17681 / MLHE-1) TaxID=187272 RepID=Q0AAH8_ALKEH|nr:exodeoxyribonuclease V subunit alpha [Alkalilimnicola ehrlichii]ABI56159.1 DNA helicase/exodeoxyribonuclease V, alpha subunit [Alkalilimnicola ehrlichii MLHE-1]